MKIKSRRFVKLLVLAVLLGLAVLPAPAQASALSAPGANDLIAAVNALRAANGLPPLRTDSSLMRAAQSHSDDQASMGTWSHKGSNGSSATQRDIAAGYGTSIFTAENVAQLSSGLTVDTLINTVWSDSLHMATMLSSRATDMGAGVTEKNGYVFYTLDVSYQASRPARIGKPIPTPTPRASAAPSAAPPTAANAPTGPTAAPAALTSLPAASPVVQTVTPQDVGIVVHVVDTGDSLYAIAVKYDTTISDIRARNGIAANNDVIYLGQKLLIRVVFTPTASPPPTGTAAPVTSTPPASQPVDTALPTATPSPTLTLTDAPTLTLAPAAALTFTPLPARPAAPASDAGQPQPTGFILAAVGLLALLGAAAYYFMRQK